MADDWFRKVSWTDGERNDFFERLNRSRKYNRAQYLRIQASHLAGNKDLASLSAALDLLEILFTDYPERTEMASAYLQKAECLLELGRVSEALIYVKKAIDFQRGFPNVQTQAPIQFGLMVLEHDLFDEFESVVLILNEFEEDIIVFPVDTYHVYAIRAIIEKRNGSSHKAKSFAEKAMEAARRSSSGFQYHASLGLVRDLETNLHRKLQAVISNN
ncbi:MAG: hypothetical protein IPO41_13355 [Acidobacteria bacterium]|nr:hypothetical protein [Acidobacteriota bacterium]MBP7475053.1 hypothetical protein [Pyrinomonadaceae bacterium]MBP9109744.1 hypothetical protein [Pyrinomonadaceae bacterium]